MKAIALFEWVIKEHQKEVLVHTIPSRRERVMSENFFHLLKHSALDDGYATVSPTVVQVVENHDRHNALNVLSKNVNAGFWVYSFTCSMDYHEFRWYANESEALKAYNAVEVAYFVCRKYLIHTEKGVLMKQTIAGGDFV